MAWSPRSDPVQGSCRPRGRLRAAQPKSKFLSPPLTDTRKVDRKALPDPGTSRPELTTLYVAPRTTIEKELAKIWAEVLSTDEVGIHDDFFDLGGHSLSATRIISRVIATFKLQLPVRALFDSPTVAAMSVLVSSNEGQEADEEDLKRLLGEIESHSEETGAWTETQL